MDESEKAVSYTTHNFDAIDEQMNQMAEREAEVTRAQRIANYFKMAKVVGLLLVATGLFFIMLGIAIRIALPSKPSYIENSLNKNGLCGDGCVISENDNRLDLASIYSSDDFYLTKLKAANPGMAEEIEQAFAKKNSIIIEQASQLSGLEQLNQDNVDAQQSLEARILELSASQNEGKSDENTKRDIIFFVNKKTSVGGYTLNVTRWHFDKSTDKEPKNLSCYLNKREAGVDLTVELGTQVWGQSAEQIAVPPSAGLSPNDIMEAFRECGWVNK